MQADGAQNSSTSRTYSDGEMPEKPKRKSYSFETKMALVGEYERQPDGGAKGEFLRREGVYKGQIYLWKKLRDSLEVVPAQDVKPKSKSKSSQAEIQQLKSKNDALQAELQRTKLALELAGKAHALLEAFSLSAASPNQK